MAPHPLHLENQAPKLGFVVLSHRTLLLSLPVRVLLEANPNQYKIITARTV
jgi:hypothetical protein